MAKFKAFQLKKLPDKLVENSLYYIESENGNDSEAYITDAAGELHNIGNTAMITAITNGLITSALGMQSSLEVYPDLTTVFSSLTSLTSNTLIVVKDASGDTTVDEGAALYIYESGPNTLIKLAEFESMDLTLSWGALKDKPTSPAAQIDDATAKRHEHANKDALDRITLDGNGLVQVDGSLVYAPWASTDW